jgi:hypothetical protein
MTPTSWYLVKFQFILHANVTERCGRVVNTPASYSGGPGFKPCPEDRLP